MNKSIHKLFFAAIFFFMLPFAANAATAGTSAGLSSKTTSEPCTTPFGTVPGITADQCKKLNTQIQNAGNNPDVLIKNLESKGIKPADIEKAKKSIEQGTPVSAEQVKQAEQALKAKDGSAAATQDQKQSQDKTITDAAQTKTEPLQAQQKKKTSLFKRFFNPGPSKTDDFNLRPTPGEYQDVETELEPFGYDFFAAAAAAPPQDIPVALDYIIGPGDEIIVLTWGRMSNKLSLSVDRDGTIQIPDIGPITVSGLSFAEMKNTVTKRLKAITGTEASVTMGKLRSIQVFVLGEVEKPGAYTLSFMADVTNALIAAGGPSDIGSLRKIDVKRNGKTAFSVDFYDLLLKGDKTRDIRLQNADVIFVHTVGSLVGISGNIKRPAIYELKDAADLGTLLDLSGGLIPTAYLQQILVERIVNNEKRAIIDINAKDIGKSRKFKLQDADMVKVFSIVDNESNVVYLRGNVTKPGRYELKDKMRVKDLFSDPETDLLRETYFDYAIIKRLAPVTEEVHIIPFNLGKLLNGDQEQNIELARRDTVQVFSKWNFEQKPVVRIQGQVRCATEVKDKEDLDKNKGICTFKLDKDMTVNDLIQQADGLTDDAIVSVYELYRTNKETKEVTLIKKSLTSAMQGDKDANLVLQDQDLVKIHSIYETIPKQYVTINGAVNLPGKYPYTTNMTLKDLIFAAGNLKESAYAEQAELASQLIDKNKSFIVTYQSVNLAKALEGDPEANIAIKPYDVLLIKTVPDWKEENFVNITGEVLFPGKYVIKAGERLSSVIERAGGLTGRAYLKGAVFSREAIKAMQQKNIDESIERFEKDAQEKLSLSIQSALSVEETAQIKAAMEQQKNIIAKLKSAKATGRIALKFENYDRIESSKSDIKLENGDEFYVPVVPDHVQVVGAVYNQASFVYQPSETVASYIDKSGGMTPIAETSDMFVLKADGSAIARTNYPWYAGSFTSVKLDPGDTVVVPQKVESISWLREAKDFTQILFQIAVSAGVIFAAFP